MSVTVKPEKSLRIHYRKSKPWGLNSCDYTSALSLMSVSIQRKSVRDGFEGCTQSLTPVMAPMSVRLVSPPHTLPV